MFEFFPARVTGLHTLEDAVHAIITRLYAGFSIPDKPVSDKQVAKTERNEQIRKRFERGEGVSALAREYGLSPQRVYQIVHNK